jgi:hypothetical protein
VLVQLSHCVLPVAAAATLGWAGRVDAQSATWTGAGDGTSWTDPNNWDTLPPNTSPGDDLTFGGGTAGTIQLQGNELANSIAFNAGFTLDSPLSTDSLTISTGNVSVGSSVSSTINAIIAGSNGFNFAGPGTLTISGSNSYTGGTNVNGGTLIASGPNSLTTGTISVATGATLMLAANTTLGGVITQNGNFAIENNVTATIAAASDTFNQNSGTLTVNGVLAMGGASFNYNGGTVAGTVYMGNSSSSPTLTLGTGAGNSGTFVFSGEVGYLYNNGSPVSIPSGVTVTFQPAGSFGESALEGPSNNAGNLNIVGSNTTTAELYSYSSTLTNTGSLTMSATGVPIGVPDLINDTLNNTTGTVNINASTQMIGSITNSGTFKIATGQTLSMGGYSFTQSAGTLAVAGTLATTYGSFNYNGGTVTGTVYMGNSSSSPTLTLGTGAGNSGTFVLCGEGGNLYGNGGSPVAIPSGVTVTFQPAGTSSESTLYVFANLNNAGKLNVVGSNTTTAELYSDTLTNTGSLTISATGIPTAAPDVIEATLNNTTGTVNVNASTVISYGNVTNSGTFNIASGQTLSFGSSGYTFTQTGGTLAVAGTLAMGGALFNYNGGTVTGTVYMGNSFYMPTLTLGAGAGNSGTFVLSGEGGYLNNNGSPVSIPSGVTVTFQPTGTSSESELYVSGNLNNAGNLNIVGSNTTTAELYSNTLTNTGTLTMSATGIPTGVPDIIYASLNNTTGTVNINASTQMNGNIANSGIFNIASGQTLSISNSSYSFTQTGGTLAVAGTLAMGGASFNYNGGTVTGTVYIGTSSSTSSLTLGAGAGNSGTFVFSGKGGYLENSGSSVSIPSGVTVTLQPTGSFGESMLEVLGNFNNAGNLNIVGSNATTAELYSNTLTNTGLLTMSATGIPTAAPDVIEATLNNTTGTVNVNASTVISYGNVTNSGTFNIARGQTLSLANIGYTFTQTGGTLTVNGDLNASVNITGGVVQLGTNTGSAQMSSLTITGNGVLDVNNDHIIITYGSADPISTIAGYIKSGYNGGAWNGPGIISSAARTPTNGSLYGVGYADGADGVVSGLSLGQIEVIYTLVGDANLDGFVNGEDFTILASNFNQAVTGWDRGDFNYDGYVNGEDFTMLAANFNQGDSGGASAGDIAALDAFAAANGLGLTTNVPEPTAVELIALAGSCLLTRRRRGWPIFAHIFQETSSSSGN